MQILTEEAQQYVLKNRPSWANFVTLEPSGTLYYWSERPLYNPETGVFSRRNKTDKLERVRLPEPVLFEI